MKILERLFNNKTSDVKKEELGRNELCWCGSGKKYKRCHLDVRRPQAKNAKRPGENEEIGRFIET